MTPANILVVDDEPSSRRYLQTLLEVHAHQVETVEDGSAAVERLQRGPVPDVVMLDLLMPGIDGLQTLEKIRLVSPQAKVIMMSCLSDSKKVVQALRMGALDYLTKPFQMADVETALQHCLGAVEPPTGSVEERKWIGEVEDLGDDVFFVAASAAMKRVRAQAAQVARVNVPVLLLGESGTGKEVVARLIHRLSARAQGKFLKVNCAALPSELLESELFGYEAGAFTGATRLKPGKFELCNHGTLFLDEIGEMAPMLQAKLLHVLQDSAYSRLGSRTTVKVDVRVMAATNVNVQQAIANRTFREDLFYRLNAFTITLPPLRERREEIPFLLKHFMSQLADQYARPPLPFSPRMMQACLKYNWPGNLRELENFVKRYLILGDEELLVSELEPKPAWMHSAADGKIATQPGNLKSLVRKLKDNAEAEAIAQALQQVNWNRKEAARMLSISYKALLYKIREFGLDQT